MNYLFPSLRQLESLIKLSEANARIRLSEHVTASDVKRVIRLYERSLKQVEYDVNQKFFSDAFYLPDMKNITNTQRDLNFFR